MDALHALRILDEFRQVWTLTEKDKVLETEIYGQKAFLIFFEITHYQVGIQVVVGPRLGITEHCTIIDTRHKEVEVDHHVASGIQRYTTLASKSFLFLPTGGDWDAGWRKEFGRTIAAARTSKDRVALYEALRIWLLAEIKHFREEPSNFEQEVKNFHYYQEEMRSSVSITAVRYGMTRM